MSTQDEDHKKLYRKRTPEEVAAIISETNRLSALLDAEEAHGTVAHASAVPPSRIEAPSPPKRQTPKTPKHPLKRRRANPERDARQAAITALVGIGHRHLTSVVALQSALKHHKPPFSAAATTLSRDLEDLNIIIDEKGATPLMPWEIDDA